jgi:hypothetical protein
MRNISFNESAVKVELLTKIKRGLLMILPTKQVGWLVVVARLPPSHCKLNLTELV